MEMLTFEVGGKRKRLTRSAMRLGRWPVRSSKLSGIQVSSSSCSTSSIQYRETGDLCFTTNRTCLLAGGARPPRSKANFVSAVADFCSQSRSDDRRKRLSGRDHGSLPNPVRVADHGDRQPPDSALQRYPTSYCGLDPTAVSRGRSQ